jgi:hypothetical protein
MCRINVKLKRKLLEEFKIKIPLVGFLWNEEPDSVILLLEPEVQFYQTL